MPGLLHKYPTKVLLTITNACAVHCRYCFRRHFDYKNNNPGLAGWKKAINYIKQRQQITEVIYSGGDPLIAKDDYLKNITDEIAKINHIKLLRIHTRIPVVNPKRITENFCKLISSYPTLKIVIAIHCNHPQEISDMAVKKLKLLNKFGVTLLNQSVLLKNINDTTNILTELSYKLFEAQVLPYYLHLLDKVNGAKHFHIDKKQALILIKSIKEQLPGYLVPKLVTERPYALSKIYLS